MSAQIKFGVEAGMNLSHYVSGSGLYDAKQVGGMKTGFQMGVTVDYQFDNHWMLMSGLTFLQNRANMKLADHSVFYFPKAEIKMNNLILPVKIGYDIRVTDKFSLLPSIGVYGAYGFSAGNCSLDVIYPSDNEQMKTETVNWKPTDGYFYQVSEHDYGNLEAFRHWDFGAVGGIKAIIANHYTIGFNYTLGIKKVQKQNGLRNSTFQFSVGYRF